MKNGEIRDRFNDATNSAHKGNFSMHPFYLSFIYKAQPSQIPHILHVTISALQVDESVVCCKLHRDLISKGS